MAISKQLWSYYSKPSDGLNLGSAWLRNSLEPRRWQHQLSDRLLCLVRSSLVLAPSSVVGHQAMLVPCGPVWSAGIRSMLGCLLHSCAFDSRRRIHLMHDCMTADLDRPLRWGVIVTRYCMTVQYVKVGHAALPRGDGGQMYYVSAFCTLVFPPIVFLQCLCHRLPLILPAKLHTFSTTFCATRC
jgi:hypothetical protein